MACRICNLCICCNNLPFGKDTRSLCKKSLVSKLCGTSVIENYPQEVGSLALSRSFTIINKESRRRSRFALVMTKERRSAGKKK